jgi:regulatory protein
MLITALQPQGKTKCRVEVDYEETFVLRRKDVFLYGLKEGEEIPEDVWAELEDQFRADALHKCGSLLMNCDYSEKGLYDKLIQSGYPRAIAAGAVAEMVKAHYVDDRRLAANYIHFHLADRSKTRIRMDLMKKGVDSELIKEAFENEEEETGESSLEAEKTQIRALLEKKHYDPEHAEWQDVQKMKAFLYRKGYSQGAIRAVMEEN